MANHEIRIDDGHTRRFWPNTLPVPDSEAPLEEIAQLLQRILKGFRLSGGLLFSLTGGRDTRINLAAARDFVSEVIFFTFRTPQMHYLDLKYSKQLAARFGLSHRIIDTGLVPARLIASYDEIGASMCSASSRVELGASFKLAASKCVHVGGVLGEVFRAHMWPTKNPIKSDSNSLARQAFPGLRKPIVDAVKQWRDSLPLDIAPSAVFDLFEFEQRSGRSAGITEACSSMFYSTVSPFNSRLLFDLLQRTPQETRYNGSLQSHLIDLMWPELLGVPFTTFGRQWWKSLPKSKKATLKRLPLHKFFLRGTERVCGLVRQLKRDLP
jgi:hypothetical protein